MPYTVHALSAWTHRLYGACVLCVLKGALVSPQKQEKARGAASLDSQPSFQLASGLYPCPDLCMSAFNLQLWAKRVLSTVSKVGAAGEKTEKKAVSGEARGVVFLRAVL